MSAYSQENKFTGRRRGAVILAGLATLLSGTALAAATVGAAPQINAARLGRTDTAKAITLSFYLPSRDPSGLAEFLSHISKRGDALYRAYLTPEQYEERFGASSADYAAVLSWAKNAGLAAGEYFTGRHIMTLTGTVQAFEAALGTHFNDYRDRSGAVFYAASEDAKLPAEVSGRIAGVIGLSGQTRFAPLARILPRNVKTYGLGTGKGGGFSAADLKSIYDVPDQNIGKRQTLGVFEQGGFVESDVATYIKANKLPTVPQKVRNVDGWNGSVSSSQVEAEAVLDIDMQIATNPQAGRILVYEEGKHVFSVALVDSLAAMAKDNAASSIDISYGTDESIQGADAIKAENGVLEQLTAQGQAVFASSGDDGAEGRSGGGLNVADPCTQPFVTCVGGTTVFPGQKETYGAEEVWNDLNAGYGATGGGVSTVWTIPGWQKPGGYSITVGNGGSSTMRNVPDVAAVANPLTGVSVYSAMNGGWIVIGGTSVSAPIWSGYYSLLIADSEALGLGKPGFANPGIYDIQALGGLVQTSLNDVVDGYNGVYFEGQYPGFFAGPEYDNTTGWGTILGNAFVVNFLTPPNGSGTPPAAPANFSGHPAATSIALKWSAAAGATGYVILVTNENTGTAQTQTVATKTEATIAGLTPSTTYYFQIYAISPTGNTSGNPITVSTTASST
jgi:kumamolisin